MTRRARKRAAGALLCAAIAPAVALAQPAALSLDNRPEHPIAPAATSAELQAAQARAGRRGALTLHVRTALVRGRWAQGLQPPLAPCELLTPQRISQAMNAVREAVTAPQGARRADEGEVEVLWIDVDFVEPRAGEPGLCGGSPTVDVVLRPLHLRVALQRWGDNVLPLPRHALGTVYEAVPPWLRTLDPRATLHHDRAAGTMLGLTLNGPARRLAPGLEAQASLSKSLDAAFHSAEAGLRWRMSSGDSTLGEQRVSLAASQQRSPRGLQVLERRSLELGVGANLKLAPSSRLWLDAQHQSGRDESSATGAADFGKTSARLLFDHLESAALTYLRAALWHDRVRPDREHPGARTAVALAASREIRLEPGRLIGVDGTFSAGRASAGTPDAWRFRGGAPMSQPLVDAPLSSTMLALPGGPALRSLGGTQAQLGGQGGTSFASMSLNIALPVQRWRTPLIPDESTDLQIDDDQPPLTLKQLLMRQVDVTGPNMLAAQLMHEGLDAGQAQLRAHQALGAVQPAVRYLVEDAPLLALRPLLMLDVAQLADATRRARWVAIGLGAQLQLATARLDAGWMHTVSGPIEGKARGALVFRLSFQNLF